MRLEWLDGFEKTRKTVCIFLVYCLCICISVSAFGMNANKIYSSVWRMMESLWFLMAVSFKFRLIFYVFANIFMELGLNWFFRSPWYCFAKHRRAHRSCVGRTGWGSCIVVHSTGLPSTGIQVRIVCWCLNSLGYFKRRSMDRSGNRNLYPSL